MSPALLIFALSGPAPAHVGAPIDAIDVHAIGETGRVVEASVGLTLRDEDGAWQWVCHEAITTPDAVIAPRYAVSERHWVGTVPALAQSRDGATAVYWTDDGCAWTGATGVSGHEVPEVALSADGAVALAVTADLADPEAGTAADNAVLRSTDGGRSFTPVLTVPGQRLTSVVMATGSAGTALVGGIDNAGQGWLHWSADAGASWTSHPAAPGELVAMALHPDDAAVGYAVVDGVGVETLLRTDDAGASVTVVLDPEGPISDVAVEPGGGAWVAFSGNAFLYAPDGVAFALETTAPPGLGVGLAGDRVLLATRYELVNSALSEGSRAAGFDPVFSFVELAGPLDCPAETEGADVCAPLWDTLLVSLGLGEDGGTEGGGGSGLSDGPDGGDGADDTGPVDAGPQDETAGAAAGDKEGCGGGGAALVVLLPLAGVGRRRPDHL